MSNCSYGPNGAIPRDGSFVSGFRSKNVIGCSGKFASIEANNATVNEDLRVDEIIDARNVKYYGAVGDGVADDTAAIQAAIDANLRGCLYFPPGVYRTFETLTINDNIDIKGCVGDAQFSSIIRTAVATPMLSIGESTAASPPWVNIGHLSFYSDVTTPGSTVIDLYNMSQSYWESMMIFGSADILLNLIPGLFEGVAQRVAYNTFSSMTIWGFGATNVSNVVFNPTDVLGFANQNTFVGGRWVPANASVIMVDFFRGNHNQFYGISMESITSDIGINFRLTTPRLNVSNLVDGCRFEGTYATASIVDNGAYNIIRNGFHGSLTIIKDTTQAGTVNAGDINIWCNAAGLQNLAQFYRNNAGDASTWNTQIMDKYVPSGESQVLRLESLRGNPANITLLQADTGAGTVFSLDGNGVVNTTGEYRVAGTQVVGSQEGAIADAVGGATVDAEARAAINALLAALRAGTGHGLIAA